MPKPPSEALVKVWESWKNYKFHKKWNSENIRVHSKGALKWSSKASTLGKRIRKIRGWGDVDQGEWNIENDGKED